MRAAVNPADGGIGIKPQDLIGTCCTKKYRTVVVFLFCFAYAVSHKGVG